MEDDENRYPGIARRPAFSDQCKQGSNMTVTYDPRYNIGYIRFRESTGEIETIKVSESLHVDLSPDGKVYGVELLDANRQLAGEGFLTFVNEASGNRNVVPTG